MNVLQYNTNRKQLIIPEYGRHIHLMVEQITSSVRWVSCVQKLISLKVDEIIECGPGNVLSGLIKRIDKRLSVRNINKLSDF